MEKATKKIKTAEELKEEKVTKKVTKTAKTAWRTDFPEIGKQVIITVEANGKRRTKVSSYIGHGMWAGMMSAERFVAWQPMPDAFGG